MEPKTEKYSWRTLLEASDRLLPEQPPSESLDDAHARSNQVETWLIAPSETVDDSANIGEISRRAEEIGTSISMAWQLILFRKLQYRTSFQAWFRAGGNASDGILC
jgi:hypothetical protein